ncbi:MAG: hypothetical protein CMM15_05140, partial [Rhodospirillaceae bacterium]|nr:hypothetical protein [Rhodospirillaceae bacterium]
NWYGRGSELKGGGISAAGDTMTWAEVSGDTHFFTSLSATIGLDMKFGVIGGDMNISLPTFIQISVTNNEKYSTLTEMKAGGVQGVKNAFDYGATVAGLHAKAVDNSTDATDLDATTVEPSINAANNDLAAGNLENPPVPVPPAAAVAAVGVAGAAAASEAAAKNLDTAAAAASKSAKEAAQKAVSEQASTAVSTAAKEAAEKAAENAKRAAEAAAAAREAAQKQVDAIADAQADALADAADDLADAGDDLDLESIYPDAAGRADEIAGASDDLAGASDDIADASDELNALADAAEPDAATIIETDTFDDLAEVGDDLDLESIYPDAAGRADEIAGATDDVVDTTEELSTKALEEMKKTADEILDASTELANFADVVSKQADEASTLAGEAAKLADDASELADQVDDLTSALKFLEDSGADADSIADVSRELKLAEDAFNTAQKAADDAADKAAEALKNLDELSDQFSRVSWTTSIPDNVGLGSAIWAGNFGSLTDYLEWVVFGGVPEVVGWYKYDYGDGSWDGERDTSGFSTTYQAGDTNPSTGQTAYLEDAEGRTEIGTDSDGNPLYWE